MTEDQNDTLSWVPPFSVGEVLASRHEFTADKIRSFATEVNDLNPLHHDAEAAARSRFGGLIASGAHTTALMLGALAGHVTPRCASLGLECDFRLRRAVPVDVTATVEWTITAIEPKPSLKGHLVSLDGVMKRGDDIFVTGGMTILVMPREALLPQG